MARKVNISIRVEQGTLDDADRLAKHMSKSGIEHTRSDILRMVIKTGMMIAYQYHDIELREDELPACELCGARGDHEGGMDDEGDTIYVCEKC